MGTIYITVAVLLSACTQLCSGINGDEILLAFEARTHIGSIEWKKKTYLIPL
jgi:hypothetical protein